MELLARETLAKGSVDMISKIFDQNLEFVSLEHRLFSLDRPGSYVQYNDPTCSDAEVSALCSRTPLFLLPTPVILKGCITATATATAYLSSSVNNLW